MRSRALYLGAGRSVAVPPRHRRRTTLRDRDALRRGQLARAGAARVPAQGVALGDRRRSGGAPRAASDDRRSHLARRGRGRRARRDLPVRGVGDPRLPAAREADQAPRARARDGRRARSPSPPRRPQRPGHGPSLLVAGGVPDAGGGPANDRARRGDRHGARRADPDRRAGERGDRRLLHGLRLRVDPFPDPHRLPAPYARLQGDLAKPPPASLQERALLARDHQQPQRPRPRHQPRSASRCRSRRPPAPWTPPDEPRRALDPLAARRGDAPRRPARGARPSCPLPGLHDRCAARWLLRGRRELRGARRARRPRAGDAEPPGRRDDRPRRALLPRRRRGQRHGGRRRTSARRSRSSFRSTPGSASSSRARSTTTACSPRSTGGSQPTPPPARSASTAASSS